MLTVAANELLVDVPRIGWYFDGLPDEVTPPTATMLRDDGKRITLTLPWRSEITKGQVERWFHAKGTFFGDDPDRTKYAYEVPQNLTFVDVDGPVALVGCRAAGARNRIAAISVGQGTIAVQLVVLGTDSMKYKKINSVRTEIPELASWTGVSSIDERVTRSADGRAQRLDLTLEAASSITLSRRLNLRISPSWRADRPAPGQHRLHDTLFVETSTANPRAWEEHLDAHQAVRDLMSVAAWEPFGYRQVLARRTDDPQRTVSGEAVGERWCDVRTYAVRPARSTSARTAFLFGFTHVGARGFGRWARLRRRFERGVGPLVGLLNVNDAHVDTALTQSSTGLEAIGYQLALDSGHSPKQAKDIPLGARLEMIRASLAMPVVRADWATRAADAYNGVKHANRQLPERTTSLNIVRENILIFRAWVATMIGVPTTVVSGALQVDPIKNALALNGLAP
jgi:hypothetical protein